MSAKTKQLGVVTCTAVSSVALLLLGSQSAARGSTTSGARLVGERYANAAIAEKALSYVGEWGGEACRDAHRSGLNGSGPYPVEPKRDASGKVSTGGDGQCRSFVNCIVWMVSKHTQWLGGQPDGTYFGAFLKAGGTEVTKLDELEKGDIVQIGNGTHTYVVIKRVSGAIFTVVDSNHDYKETVLTYNRSIALNADERAFQMGQAASQASSGPSPPPFTDRRGVRACGAEVYVVQSYNCGVARDVQRQFAEWRTARPRLTVNSGLLVLPLKCGGTHPWVVCRSTDNQDLIVGFGKPRQCGTLTRPGGTSRITATVGTTCAVARRIVTTYDHEPASAYQGSGAFVQIGIWWCGTASGSDYQQTGHSGSCDSKRDAISMDRP